VSEMSDVTGLDKMSGVNGANASRLVVVRNNSAGWSNHG
jgi:hypothetical protein